MLNMVPGAWYQRPQQVPGLTLAQAVSPSLQHRPQPTPPQTLPVMPQPQYLAAPPEPDPLSGTIQDPAWRWRTYSDEELQNFQKYNYGPGFSNLNPGDSERIAAELKLRGLGPLELPDSLGVSQAPYNRRGHAPVDWTQMHDKDTSPATESDPAFADLLAGLVGGGDAAPGAPSWSAPGLPARPQFGGESPDFGDFPTAPVLAGPDFSRANQYFEAAKPKGYEADPEDMGLAILAGAIGGFSPYGSVGEILGRMAGPGVQGGFAQHKEDEALGRQADRDLQAWNSAMGGVASDQSIAESETANTNAQNQYTNAVAKYQDAQSRYQMAREDERWQATYDLQRAQAELQRAEAEMRAPVYAAQAGYYQRRGSSATNPGGLSMGSIIKTITDGVNAGALPGIEGMNEQLEATKQALLAGAQTDPNKLALYMGDPKQLDIDARRMLVEQIYQLAQTNPELMQSLLMSSMKGKTGMSMEDVILGLSGE